MLKVKPTCKLLASFPGSLCANKLLDCLHLQEICHQPVMEEDDISQFMTLKLQHES